MVKLSRLNPEDMQQVILRLLLESFQPYLSQALGDVFDRRGNPLANLRKFLKRTSGQLAVTVAAAGTAGGATSAVALWRASLRLRRGVGYRLGLVTVPLLTPLIGGLLGLGLAAGGAALLIGRLRSAEARTMARLHAQIFSIMLHADGVQDEQRLRILEEIKDRLIGSGLKSDEIEHLFSQAPRRPEELSLDADSYEPYVLRGVLISAWQLAQSQGEVAPAAVHAFRRMCLRLGLGDEVAAIQSQAQEALESQSVRIGAAIDAARHLGSDFDGAAIKDSLESLIALDPLGNAQRRRSAALRITTDVTAAAGAIAAVVSGTSQALPIIGQAYAAVHAAVASDEQATKRLQARALDLLTHLGVKPEDASAFLNPLIETLEVMRANRQDQPSEKRSFQKPNGSSQGPHASSGKAKAVPPS